MTYLIASGAINAITTFILGSYLLRYRKSSSALEIPQCLGTMSRNYGYYVERLLAFSAFADQGLIKKD